MVTLCIVNFFKNKVAKSAQCKELQNCKTAQLGARTANQAD